MILLDNTKSLATLKNDKSNGLGRLGVISAFVEEKINGIYELNFDLPITDKHYNDLKINGLIRCNAGEIEGQQMFRIKTITRPINSVVSVYCQHVSYDLSKMVVKPFNSTGISQTLTSLQSNVVGNNPFNITSNITDTQSEFKLDVPRNYRECLGGFSGSMLETFGGELEWDNLTVKLLSRRGSDTDVRIAYGKNLTDFKQEEKIEKVYDGVVGYAKTNEEVIVGDPQLVQASSNPRLFIKDFSSDFKRTGNEDEQAITVEAINQKALEYARDNKINEPEINFTISFVPLWQTEEYKDIAPFERVGLGDSVTVDFPKLNVTTTARVVSRKWNVILERYDSLELGSDKETLSTSISNTVIKPLESQIISSQITLSENIETNSRLIVNALGLHQTVVVNQDGTSQYYIHNKPSLANSDTQYVLTDNGFKISTDGGQTFRSGFDTSGNAILNALSSIILTQLNIQGLGISGSAITKTGRLDINGTKVYINGTDTDDYLTSVENVVTGVKGNAESTYRHGNVNITAEDIGITGTVTGVKGNAESTYRSGDVNITPANIGLGNVNNTSDLDKPISTATQTALNTKAQTVDGVGIDANYNVPLNAFRYMGVASGDIDTYYGDDKMGYYSATSTLTGNKPTAYGDLLVFKRYSNSFQMWIVYTSAVIYTRTWNGTAWTPWVTYATGVKGNAETDYRTGNVNLTPANIGAQPTLVSGTNIKTIGGQSLLGSGNLTPANIGAQPTLVSGTNIKTLNNISLLGNTNISVSGPTGRGVMVKTSGDTISLYNAFNNIASPDLNEMTYNYQGYVATCTNGPSGVNANGELVVVARQYANIDTAPVYCKQLYFPYNNGKNVYERTLNNGTWTAWTRLAVIDDLGWQILNIQTVRLTSTGATALYASKELSGTITEVTGAENYFTWPYYSQYGTAAGATVRSGTTLTVPYRQVGYNGNINNMDAYVIVVAIRRNTT